MGGRESARKIVQQIRKCACERRRPCDQNIVMPVPAMKGKKGRSGCPQPPFCAIAGHRIADFAAGREADAQMAGNGHGCRAEFQCQAYRRAAYSACGAEKIRAVFEAVQNGHARPAGRLRPKASCGHARGGAPAPCVRRPWPCANGIHDGACGRVCSVDTGASWLNFRGFAGPLRKSGVSKGVGVACQPIRSADYFIPKIPVNRPDLPFPCFI